MKKIELIQLIENITKKVIVEGTSDVVYTKAEYDAINANMDGELSSPEEMMMSRLTGQGYFKIMNRNTENQYYEMTRLGSEKWKLTKKVLNLMKYK